jgi:hypothetical protein
VRPRHLLISVGVVFAVVATSGTAARVSAATRVAGHPVLDSARPGRRPVQPAGAGESAFFTAVLGDLGDPATRANLSSLAGWASREGPWGSVGRNNPLDTTLPAPGATWFNTITLGGGQVIHVMNYPTPAVGAAATAATISGGSYPRIAADLASGAGLCGDPAAATDFLTWSGSYTSPAC